MNFVKIKCDNILAEFTENAQVSREMRDGRNA